MLEGAAMPFIGGIDSDAHSGECGLACAFTRLRENERDFATLFLRS